MSGNVRNSETSSEDDSSDSDEDLSNNFQDIRVKREMPEEPSDPDSESDTENPARVSSLGPKNMVMNSRNEKTPIPNHEESETNSEESSEESEDSSEGMKDKNKMPDKSSDSDSDSETDIEKPSRTSNVSPKNISVKNSTPAMKSVQNHEESTDSSEESDEELSMSLLQKSGKPKSPQKNSYGVLSSSVASIQHVSGVATSASAQRKENHPVMSSSDSEPESVSQLDTSHSCEVKEESTFPTSVPYEPEDVTENESTQQEVAESNAVALQYYTHISSSPFDIPEDSCVWLLQVPQDVSASDLIGQKLPTQLHGGEKLDLPSYSLLIREQPSEQSKRSLVCMMSTGDSTYKLQRVHLNGFWTLRRPPVLMSKPVTEHTWGVPIAPVPVEELLKTKTNKEKLPSAVFQGTQSHSKKHRTSGLQRIEETSPSPKKHKKNKREKSKHTETCSLAEDSNQMGNATKSRKRSHSTCEEEDISPLMKKKKRKEKNSFQQNNYQNNQHSDESPSSSSKKSNLGEIRKEKKKKKSRDKCNNSFDSTILIKQEDIESENELVSNANNVPKKKKNKDKSRVSKSNIGDLSNSLLEILDNLPIKSERMLNDSVRDSGQEEEGGFKKRKRKETESSFEMEHQMKSSLSMMSDNDDSVLKKKKKRKHSK